MKKIGVITFSKSINYGAFLQAYALQKALKSLGYNPSLIDYENPVDKARYDLINRQSAKSVASSLIFLSINILRRRNFKKDAKLVNYTAKDTHYDVAITGSDQVWNPKITGNKIEKMFFLDGVNASRKLSYAASIANENIIEEYKKDFSKYLNEIDYVSVREAGAKRSLEKLTKKPIALVADPTLLLTQAEWKSAISDISKEKSDYIFAYFVNGIGSAENRALTKACDKLNLKCTTFSKIPKEKRILKYAYTYGPRKFLASLRDSKLVLTSSFHGVVLSIMMHKNFYYFLPRPDRRSRVDSILNILGLTDRIIETEADIDRINLEDINYIEPQKKLDKLRQESLDWLKNAIEN